MLQSIARRIEIRAQNLAAEHQEFVDSLDRLLSEHDTTEAQLYQLIDRYTKLRKWLRDVCCIYRTSFTLPWGLKTGPGLYRC